MEITNPPSLLIDMLEDSTFANFFLAKPYKLITGFPVSRLSISISFNLIPSEKPVPIAFATASLAENFPAIL